MKASHSKVFPELRRKPVPLKPASEQQTRRPIVSAMEWRNLTPAERIKQFANPAKLPVHPALATVQEDDDHRVRVHPALAIVQRDDDHPVRVHPALAAVQKDDDHPVCVHPALAIVQKDDDHPVCVHPALATVQGDGISPVDSVIIEEEEHELIDQEPDYAARAAKVRLALQERMRQETLEKLESRGPYRRRSPSSASPRPRRLSKIFGRRLSVNSVVSHGKAMTRSLSQKFPTLHRSSEDDKENRQDQSPQTVHSGSVKRKPVPDLETWLMEMGHLSRREEQEVMLRRQRQAVLIAPRPPERRPLAELSPNKRQPERVVQKKAKQKIRGFRSKLKQAFQIWRE